MNLNDSTEDRWYSPDLLGGDITNPQSLNRYAYVLNNPTTLTDPLGLGPNDCGPTSICIVVPVLPNPPGLGGGIGECPSFNCVPNCSIFACGPMPGQPGGGGGGTGGGSGASPPSKPTPKPDVPLNSFATAVFARVGCETQFLDKLPSISGGGVFGLAGFQPEIPGVPVKGEAYGIVNYDTNGGLSTGFLLGIAGTNGPAHFLGGGLERAYNWNSHSWSNEGVGFFGGETQDLNIGTVGGGLFFGTQGAVGLYGEIGPFGGGGYLNLSYGACS